jgi:hypothetical protein
MAVQLISVHVPKAGGVSLWNSLRAAYGDDAVLNDDSDDPADPCGHFALDPDDSLRANREREIPDAIEVIHGHFHASKYLHVPNAARITFLRNPVLNLVSIYYYWKTLESSHPLFQYARAHDLGLLRVARLPALRFLFSRTYFGGVDMHVFDYVGTLEQYSEGVRTVSELIGKPLVENTHNRNGYSRYHEEVQNLLADRVLMSKLRDALREDLRFYEAHARSAVYA